VPEAVEQLARTQRIDDARWQATLQETFPLPTLQQSLAAHLVHHALAETRAKHPTRFADVARRLEEEFYDAYPSPPVERTDRPFYEPKPPFPTASENAGDGERNGPRATIKEGRTTSRVGAANACRPLFPGGRGPARPGDGHA
jgi:hypothetical protein